eukprot:TRINITY_DN110590_c0_g1_i1.p1 TRINITY_DN110590_c0_g1~~TRINITY_DN110590_c0_g1_i1.p1  ORF type:complete len:295 (+),score=23.56 TRINITY_DN110590_c0_g1_i1:96-887(+)
MAVAGHHVSDYNPAQVSESEESDDGLAGYDGKMELCTASGPIRRGFIRKVYGILSVQILVTLAIAAPMNLYLDRNWMVNNMALYNVAKLMPLVVLLGTLCCCKEKMREFPWNYLILAAITVSLAFTTGFFSIMYTTSSFLLALGVTAFVFLGLSAYATFTKTDFTGMGPYLCAVLLSFVGVQAVLGLMQMFGAVMPSWVHTAIACGGVVLFSCYIVYDTQMIVGGAHKQASFTVDDYAMAALTLYLDIINLFLYILQLVGNRN